MEITKDSDFASAKTFVQTFIDGLNKCDTTFKGSIINKQDAISNITFSGFDDPVGQTFKDRITDLKTGEFKSLEEDFEGGGFKELEKNAKALLNEIQVCINSKKKIAEAEEAMEKAWEWTSQYVGFDASNPNWAPSYQGGQQGSYKSVRQKKQPDYNNAEAKKKEGEAELENGVKYANIYIKEFPNIHFTGNSNAESSSQSEETTAAASSSKYPLGKYVKITDLIDNPLTTIYDPDLMYYQVDCDLGDGMQTYLFRNEETYLSAMQQRESFAKIAQATNSGEDVTVRLPNGETVDVVYTYDSMQSELSSYYIKFTQDYGYSSGYPNVVDGLDTGYFDTSNYYFVDTAGNQYTMAELMQGEVV